VIYLGVYHFLFDTNEIERDLRVGAILREQNALPYITLKKAYLLAKTDVNNIGAGRAAKGANPFLCATKKDIPTGISFFVCLITFISIHYKKVGLPRLFYYLLS